MYHSHFLAAQVIFILIEIPNCRFLPTRKNRKRKNLDKSITSMLRTIIQRKESMMRTRETNAEDLLSLLLQSNYENSLESTASNKNNMNLTMEEIIEECKQFYLAGHETTSSLLTWTMIVLAMHPNWQDKAREEVIGVCGKQQPNAAMISQLKIVSILVFFHKE